jgi:hypothetical protein
MKLPSIHWKAAVVPCVAGVVVVATGLGVSHIVRHGIPSWRLTLPMIAADKPASTVVATIPIQLVGPTPAEEAADRKARADMAVARAARQKICDEAPKSQQIMLVTEGIVGCILDTPAAKKKRGKGGNQ